jgi:hypothetical protein
VRRALIALVVPAAALLAGCGSGTKPAGPEGGAAVAPKSASFLLRVNTAFDSPQWNALLRQFPDGETLLTGIAGQGVDFQRDVKPALGPETDLVALTGEDVANGAFLGLTQPRKPAKLDALLAKGTDRSVSEEVADWRVIAKDRPTIDRFKEARNDGVLADSEAYKAATDGLPAGALATVYADGALVTSAIDKQLKIGTGPVPGLGRIGWLGGAITSKRNGLALDVRLQGDEIEASPFVAELPAEVPADVSLFVDLKGLDATLDELKRTPAFSKLLGPAAQALGGLLDDVIALFKGEAAFYIRPGTPAEYTLVLKVADQSSASATIDRLATLVSAFLQKVPEPVAIAGVSAKKLTVGKVTLYYAIFDGKLVITTTEDGISGLRQGARLADSKPWQDAKTAAGAPDENAGILYADVQLLAPVLAKLHLSSEAKRNLAALGTAFVYASVDGDVLSLKGFVSVR